MLNSYTEEQYDCISELNNMTEHKYGLGPLEDSKELQQKAFAEATQANRTNSYDWDADLAVMLRVLAL